jgi:hypothetical protein
MQPDGGSGAVQHLTGFSLRPLGDDGLPVWYYEWAETVESLRDNGEMVQVRFG